MFYRKTILVTGGAGFIGSHLTNYLLDKYPNYRIVVMDCITYAADLNFLNKSKNLKLYVGNNNGDITDQDSVAMVFREEKPDVVLHLAAESHVDRSISSPGNFIDTNIIGTFNLLEASRKLKKENFLFLHVSTDEVYGSLDDDSPSFTETTAYSPRSPYSASKASSDHLAMSYYHTYGLPVIVTHCSNNYGPHQHQEKFIPTIIKNILNNEPIPVYGNGKNIRDWIYVGDHVKALDLLTTVGKIGEIYNIGAMNELCNISIIEQVFNTINKVCGSNGLSMNLKFIKDRDGHDFRYSIDPTKIIETTGWTPTMSLLNGLEITVKYYRDKLYV